MKPFLTYIAEDLIRKYGNDLSDIAIVFPNKRASLFLNESLARLADKPIWSPKYITISDLFRQHCDLKAGDPIKLVCDLHKVFVQCTGIDETLDHFYGWGQLLISDFDDIDKNMADADKLFANLKDIHELDDISYLTDEQKRMIRKFFSNFSEDHNSELKKRFLQLWSHFCDIYHTFNDRLASQGLAYEGALYRKVVGDNGVEFRHRKYIFVGFNMMQRVEQMLCDRLQKEGKAEFYWDYDRYYMDGKNEAGHYIRQHLKAYPNELADTPQGEIYDNMGRSKDITYVSAPTENIQARYVQSWLLENQRYRAGRKTAVVLADESLLQSVIHSLPKEVESVNITIGYPLQQTPFHSLVQQLLKLQTLGHPKGSDTYRLHYVNMILRHPYARFISSRYHDLLSDLDQHKRFYPTRESLCLEGDEGLTLLFSDLEREDNYNLCLTGYLLAVLKTIGVNAKTLDDHLFQESLFRTYTLLNRLHGLIEAGDLTVDTITLERLVQQLIQTTSIPFHGEPAEGIQVMGVLETRNLDFDHVLVLSCNEGNLPKGVSDSSFIPYSIRKAYGLTTVDNKVAIYAYYFHSLLQRAGDITLCYNNATEDGHTGEMSRFMLQLMVESRHPIRRQSLVTGQVPLTSQFREQPKTDEVMAVLEKGRLVTPTFLSYYLRCPKRFYYKYIKGLKEPEVIDEDEVDNKVFGNIFHRAAELFYLQCASPSCIQTNADGDRQIIRPFIVGKEQIEYALHHTEILYRLVDEAFREQLFMVEAKNYRPHYNGLQLINREVIVNYLKQLLLTDSRLAPFTILGLEVKVTKSFEFDTPIGRKRLLLGGFIDRLDAVAKGDGSITQRIRVIDYKTGRVPSILPRSIDDIFNREEVARHTDYYLQALLYSLIVGQDTRLNPAHDAVSPALLFIQCARAEQYDPTLKLGKELIVDASVHEQPFMEGLEGLVSEIYNPSIPFVPTSDTHRCESCPYAALCKEY